MSDTRFGRKLPPLPVYDKNPDRFKIVDCFGDTYAWGTEAEMSAMWMDWGDEDPAAIEAMGYAVVPASALWHLDTRTGRLGWRYKKRG